MTIKGAGVIITDGKHIVVGQSRETGKWEDFGGSREKGESVWDAARRELYEESACLFTLDKKPETYVDVEHRPKKVYRLYIAYVRKLNPRWIHYFSQNVQEVKNIYFREMKRIGFIPLNSYYKYQLSQRLSQILEKITIA